MRCVVIPCMLALISFGCNSQPQPRHSAFNEADYAKFADKGNSAIRGQVFMWTPGFERKFAAGGTIALLPATTYTDEWWNRQFLKGENLKPGTPEIASVIERSMRHTLAGPRGEFDFTSIPAGNYYVLTKALSTPSSGEQGGDPLDTYARDAIGLRVTVAPSERKYVIVCPNCTDSQIAADTRAALEDERRATQDAEYEAERKKKAREGTLPLWSLAYGNEGEIDARIVSITDKENMIVLVELRNEYRTAWLSGYPTGGHVDEERLYGVHVVVDGTKRFGVQTMALLRYVSSPR